MIKQYSLMIEQYSLINIIGVWGGRDPPNGKCSARDVTRREKENVHRAGQELVVTFFFFFLRFLAEPWPKGNLMGAVSRGGPGLGLGGARAWAWGGPRLGLSARGLRLCELLQILRKLAKFCRCCEILQISHFFLLILRLFRWFCKI